MKTCVLSIFLFLNALLLGENPLPITEIPNLFTIDQIQSVRTNLAELLATWKLKSRTQRVYAGTELKQLNILITANKNTYNYIKLTFLENNRLTDESLMTLEKNLRATNATIKPMQEQLKMATFDLFVQVIHQFAKQIKLKGEHSIRCDLRGFIVYLEDDMDGALTNILQWHWDYCSHSSMVTELYSDFDEAELIFARNINSPPLRDCTKPASHNDAIPDEKTIITFRYPKNGALMFPAERGGLIHCPTPPLVPAGKQGLLMRIILQVVLIDQEWLNLTKKYH